MKDYIPIITAIIAFVGTAMGIVMGYRKWRKEQASRRYSQFEIDKQNAYKELWQRVEDFNIKVRLEEISSEDFSNHLQNLNAFLLKHGIYINEEDKNLANEYADSVYRFQKIVRDSNMEEANVALGDTQEIPGDVIEKVGEIGEAQQQALGLRKELIKRIKSVLSGNND